MLIGLTCAALAACSADNPTEIEGLAASAATVAAARVNDLAVVAATDSTVELRWTQVEDGRDRPALYRVKYATRPITWATATIGCDAKGMSIGAPISCTVPRLAAGTTYDFQLMSYRLVNNQWQGATYSNIVTGSTLARGGSAVGDLAVAGTTASSLRVQWTQIGYGTAGPATYRVKYGPQPFNWSTASTGCDTTLNGAVVGAPMSCTINGLTAGATYAVQLMSYRIVNGAWQDSALSNLVTGTVPANAAPVVDLAASASTDTTITVRWTEVSDGKGSPAWYRVRYSDPPLAWSGAQAVCDPTPGTAIGGQKSCTIRGLSAEAAYDVQVMSYRNESGTGEGEVLSNVARATTEPAPATGIWISPPEIAALPMSGPGWTNVLAAANASCAAVNLTDQEQSANVCVLAKALVFARTGNTTYRSAVVTAISQIVASGTYDGRALSLGRELGAYVVAADLIGLKSFNPALDTSFRSKLRTLRTTFTTGAATSLIDCHERRPNNWGAHCGATRAAIAVYLGDTADLARTAQVFKGFLGDRSSWAGFDFGGPEADLSWQCDPTRPVGINPAGCLRSGALIDGIIPDDQRRAGAYTWPAPHENYVWEALQGLLAQAVILHRAGYPVWDWENRALLRAVTWVHNVNGYPPEGDDRWLTHIVNRAYGSSFPAAVPATAGKGFGWTDWTHR